MTKMKNEQHISVLKEEFLSFFQGREIKKFVDGTLGLGGHSLAILEEHSEIEQLIGFDRDSEAIELATKKLEKYREKLTTIKSDFSQMDKELEQLGIRDVDGIFLDIGVSSLQLDQERRGFSFQKDGPLDMRMNQDQELTAEVIVMTWPEKKILELFKQGEVPQFRKLARVVVENRRNKRIDSTEKLNNLLKPFIRIRRARINPMTLIYQALRIAVNNELEVLKEVIPKAVDLLKPGGLLGIISFHSLEDRIVKHTFREQAGKKNVELAASLGGEDVANANTTRVKILTKKPITALREETRRNPRSRSAKMRFVEKLAI